MRDFDSSIDDLLRSRKYQDRDWTPDSSWGQAEEFLNGRRLVCIPYYPSYRVIVYNTILLMPQNHAYNNFRVFYFIFSTQLSEGCGLSCSLYCSPLSLMETHMMDISDNIGFRYFHFIERYIILRNPQLHDKKNFSRASST